MERSARTSWRHVRDRIHGQILDSTYRPGDRLPRDEDLAQQLGCSRATVQRAMRELAESGTVQRRRKGGTQVRSDPVTRATLDIPITRVEIEQKGGRYDYHLIHQEVIAAPIKVTAQMGLASGTRVMHVEALHLADYHPYMFEDRWICLETVPEIISIDLNEISANEWLLINKPYDRCDVRFYANKATGRLQEILTCEANEALFVVERATWLGGRPITSVTAISGPGYQLRTQILK